ncbi:heterokaryon incompatibility protein-domain-containing protein [Xylaria flabelliformis]|nr:heterokaryon incompatibility protein-domain-containing protein [Xylaria flabelliformis]
MNSHSPPQTFTLSLRGTNSLDIQLSTGDGVRDHRIPLDHHIGNKEGKFDINGYGFSRSAKNVRLVNNVLHATLKTSFGTWWDDQIMVEIEVSAVTETPIIKFRSYDFMRLKGCRYLRLIDGPFLACQILQTDLTYKEAWADLNGFLGNDNGVFSRHKTDFTYTTTNFRLIGSTLYGYLRNDNGSTSHSSINLTDILEAKGKLLKPLKNNVSEEFYDYEIVPDIPSHHHWLLYGGNCRLLVHAAKRRWILLANCLTPNGIIRESAIALSALSSPYWNIMHGNFDIPNTPDNAKKVKLEGGRLTAYYIMNHKNLKHWQESSIIQYQWTEKTIDLKEILTNQGGRLILSSGSYCSKCSNLFQAGFFYNPFIMGLTRRTRIDVAAIGKKVSRKPCAVCKLFHATIKRCSNGNMVHGAWMESKSSTISAYHEQPNLELVIQTTEKHSKFAFMARATDKPKATQRFTILLEPGGKIYPCGGVPQHLRTIRQNSMPSYLYPQRRWSVVESWITGCVDGHDECQGKEEMDLPSRFLDIGENESDIIRVASSTSGQKGIYACLSHCWGGKTSCMLIKSTKKQFSESIPRSVMPRVFLEAIGVCQRLGIKRLWIDSLCIQQDSKEDWEHEARKMSQYYSNCFVCIAATSSSSSSGTLELVKHPQETVIRSTGQDSQTGPYCLIAIPSELLDIQHFGKAYQRTQPANFPLMSRAWAMQERWLSPRTLHFCGIEIVFECAKMTICECGRASQDIMHELEARHHDFLRSTTSTGLRQLRENIDLYTWPSIVTEYSALDLSHPTDRLIALSGLATIKEYRYVRYDQAEGTNPRYLAGLWRDHLANQLAWFVGETLLAATANGSKSDSQTGSIRRRPKPQEYLAPSWSWASVMDPVRYLWYDGGDGEPLFELQDAHISLTSQNPYGGVQEGCYIKIRGRLLKTSWKGEDRKDGTKTFVLVDVVGTQQLDRENMKGIIFSPDYLLTDLESGDQLAILPLARLNVLFQIAGVNGDLARASRTTMCLVLRRVNNRSLASLGNGNVYQRIGFTEYVSFENGVRNMDANNYVEQDIVII